MKPQQRPSPGTEKLRKFVTALPDTHLLVVGVDEAPAGVVVPPGVEGGQVRHPAPVPVHRGLAGGGEVAPRDHHLVCQLDSAGSPGVGLDNQHSASVTRDYEAANEPSAKLPQSRSRASSWLKANHKRWLALIHYANQPVPYDLCVGDPILALAFNKDRLRLHDCETSIFPKVCFQL